MCTDSFYFKIAPTIAVKLWTEFVIFWVSVYIAFSALLTLLSVIALTETYQSDLNKTQ
jgi:hypothetical protein